MKRTVSVLLLLTMLVSTASCGSGGGDVKDTSADTGTDTTSSVPEVAPDALGIPDDVRFDGKTIRILNTEKIISGPESLDSEEIIVNQNSLVSEANYKRKIAVEERLGITIEFIEEPTWTNVKNLVRQSVNAQSNDYDMVFTCAIDQSPLVAEGCYLPVSDLAWVDLEKPWWYKEYIDSVSLNAEEPYILVGDITYNTLQRSTCVYFNERLLNDKLGMATEEIYDLVLDGKWTIDKMTEMVKSIYEDDGNSIKDENDTFGIVLNESYTTEYMVYGAGIEFTSRDEDGYPVLAMNNERTVDLIDKLFGLLHNESTFVSDNGGHMKIFGEGRSLFLANRLLVCDWGQLREMKDDYGIIPMPKYDETIDGYHVATETLVQWGAVPVTATELEMISAVAECMAYYGKELVTPAYYETALKLKLTRGDIDIASRMLDIITEGARTDFLFVNQLGGLGAIFKTIDAAGQNNFASRYASLEPVALQNLNKMIAEHRSR